MLGNEFELGSIRPARLGSFLGAGTEIQTLQKHINSTPRELVFGRTRIPGQKVETTWWNCRYFFFSVQGRGKGRNVREGGQGGGGQFLLKIEGGWGLSEEEAGRGGWGAGGEGNFMKEGRGS